MRQHRSLFHPLFAVFLIGGMLGMMLATSQPAWTDDRDLLRFNSAEPYLFILLDSSASMAMRMDNGAATLAAGDDPNSKLYIAKSALYEVFKDVDDVNFGFATFNQNQERVRGKHWLYYVDASSLPSNWSSSWPFASGSSEWPRVTTDANGIATSVADAGGVVSAQWVASPGSIVTFGTHHSPAPGVGSLGVLGSCASPVSITQAAGRAQINAFGKLDDGTQDTVLWVAGSGNHEYRLTFTRPGNKYDNNGNSTVVTNAGLGQDHMQVRILVDQVTSCPNTFSNVGHFDVDFRLDPDLNQYLMINNAGGEDPAPAVFSGYGDAIGGYTCSSASPFTGYGSEGNYDSNVKPSDQGITDPGFDAKVTDQDRFCFTDTGGSNQCVYVKPVQDTTFDSRGRPLDMGDFIPFDWNASHKADFLRRLSPDFESSATPHFDVARFISNTPINTAASVTGKVFPVADSDQKPILAAGETALARALTDVRCWYMGTAQESGGNSKCRTTAFSDDNAGWRNIACDSDSKYGCRKPYIIVISDGDRDSGNCQVQSPTASVSDLDQFSGMKTWGLYIGQAQNGKCPGNSILNSLTNSGGGECIPVTSKQDLLNALQDILGQIRETSRSFASAAVPTVQATAEQTIYVSNFTPLQNKSVWEGHMNAFLKPLPLDANGRPDLTDPNFIWDAGEVLLNGVNKTVSLPNSQDPANPISITVNGPSQIDTTTPVDWNGQGRRHIIYGMQSVNGTWPNDRALYAPTVSGTTPPAQEYDLWSGMGGITYDPTGTNTALNDAARAFANSVITNTTTVKTHVDSDGNTIRYILGDVFHSNPVVVGNPANTLYYAEDLGADPTDTDTCSTANVGNHGYRCFYERHRFRRKVLYVGHDDGMLHAFSAGIYQTADARFDLGTGNELFAFVPRAILPTMVKVYKTATGKQEYSVDDSPQVADVFIDPVFSGGTPTPTDREWRTVLVSGLREGGKSYFALDVTQPDPLSDYTDPRTGDHTFAPSSPLASVAKCTQDPLQAGCGPVPYGAPLWEFTDRVRDTVWSGAQPPAGKMDEDVDTASGKAVGNGAAPDRIADAIVNSQRWA